MSNILKSLVFLIAAILVLLLGLMILVKPEEAEVNSYETCVEADGTASLSYPSTCSYKGQTYVQEAEEPASY